MGPAAVTLASTARDMASISLRYACHLTRLDGLKNDVLILPKVGVTERADFVLRALAETP